MFYRWHNEKLILECYVKPGACKSVVSGLHDGRLKIALKSPAKEGKANKGLVKLLADLFAVSQSCISIIRGKKSRYKKVCIIAPRCISVDDIVKRAKHHLK